MSVRSVQVCLELSIFIFSVSNQSAVSQQSVSQSAVSQQSVRSQSVISQSVILRAFHLESHPSEPKILRLVLINVEY